MSEVEYLECFKCGQQVDQILALQCDHNLCLQCAARAVQKWQGSQQPLICSICGSQTHLDPSAVSVLLDMSSVQHSIQEEYESLETKQSFHSITCTQHLNESTTLYCFTCETSCFCMECYLQGLHKNHEVRNVGKCFDQVKETADTIYAAMKQSQEQLLYEQCKATNKKQELIEIVSQAKLQITNNFEELYKTLKLKEQELLQAADELIQDKLIELETINSKFRNNIEKIQYYQENFIRLFSDCPSQVSLVQSIEACNYLVKERKKISQLLDSVNKEKQLPIIQSQFCLDTQTVSQMIDDVRSVKLSVVSLRGVETTQPTQREKYIFQKVLEEKGNTNTDENSNYSFIERSSQKKSQSFQQKFNEAKKQILQKVSYI
ncbi:hypothetical protein pb186bvf_000982 [Paramecium bursaria]